MIALDCANAVKDYVPGGALVEAGIAAKADQLLGLDTPLKSLAAFAIQ